MVEIQAGTDRQRVGGRQIWGRSTGKAETGLRHTVQRRVSVGEQCDWICAFKRPLHTEDAWSQRGPPCDTIMMGRRHYTLAYTLA